MMTQVLPNTPQATPASASGPVATGHQGGGPDQGAHTGVLLVNLGTPDSTRTGDVRRYLRQFLLDGRVIDINPIARWMLVNGIIAPFRAPKSAKAYREVWLDEGRGSPLKYYGLQLERLVQAELGEEYAVRLAMRYREPSIESVLAEFQNLPLRRLIVVPLFPQYASATTGSVIEEVMRVLSGWQLVPDVRIISRFFEEEGFLDAFVRQARPVLERDRPDFVLFSYHGLPERQIRKGDRQGVCVLGACCGQFGAANQWCYRAQCHENTRLLAARLGLAEGTYRTTFQSRLGRDPWLQPYTEETIKELAKAGYKRVMALSPSFVADCLETTLEIGVEYREVFEHAGGEHWSLVSCPNDDPAWAAAVAGMVRKEAGVPALS